MGGGAVNSEVIQKLYMYHCANFLSRRPPKLPNLDVHSLHELFLFRHLG